MCMCKCPCDQMRPVSRTSRRAQASAWTGPAGPYSLAPAPPPTTPRRTENQPRTQTPERRCSWPGAGERPENRKKNSAQKHHTRLLDTPLTTTAGEGHGSCGAIPLRTLDVWSIGTKVLWNRPQAESIALRCVWGGRRVGCRRRGCFAEASKSCTVCLFTTGTYLITKRLMNHLRIATRPYNSIRDDSWNRWKWSPIELEVSYGLTTITGYSSHDGGENFF